MSETVKVGIVGIGNMGSAHAKSIFSGNIKGMAVSYTHLTLPTTPYV